MDDLFFGPGGTLRNGWKALLFGLGAVICNGVAFSFRLSSATPWLPAPWFSFAAFLCLTWFCLHLEGRSLGSVGLRPGLRWVPALEDAIMPPRS